MRTAKDSTPFNLAKVMREHGVTIADLSAKTGITQKRIREIRALTHVHYCTFTDLYQAITGVPVFNPVHFHNLSERGLI